MRWIILGIMATLWLGFTTIQTLVNEDAFVGEVRSSLRAGLAPAEMEVVIRRYAEMHQYSVESVKVTLDAPAPTTGAFGLPMFGQKATANVAFSVPMPIGQRRFQTQEAVILPVAGPAPENREPASTQ